MLDKVGCYKIICLPSWYV